MRTLFYLLALFFALLLIVFHMRIKNHKDTFDFIDCHKFNNKEHLCRLKGEKYLVCSIDLKKNKIKYMQCQEH